MRFYQRWALRALVWAIRRWYKGHLWYEVLCHVCEHNNPYCESCEDMSEWDLSKEDAMEVGRCYGPPMCVVSDEPMDCPFQAELYPGDFHCFYGECFLHPFEFHCRCGSKKERR